MVRTYTQIVGVMLVLTGLWGLAGVMSTNSTTGFYHLPVGVFFAYLGFLQRDTEVVREVVGGLGVLLVPIMVVTILAPLLWGEEPLLGSVEVTCLVLGILSILATRYLPNRAPRREDLRRAVACPVREDKHGTSRVTRRRAFEAPGDIGGEGRPAT